MRRRGFIGLMLALGGTTAVAAQTEFQHPTEAQLNGMTEEECDCPTTNEPFQGEHEPDGTEIHPEDHEGCPRCPPEDYAKPWLVSCPVCRKEFDAHGDDSMTEELNGFAIVVCPAKGCGVFFSPVEGAGRKGE